MAKIGLIDVDGHNFPNIPLMKLSAWHKAKGNDVEWHRFGEHYDIVYMSKVFSDSPDYDCFIDADYIVSGGSGYAIHLVDGKECYEDDINLLPEVEHIYPDYGLYPELTKDTAFGFLTRGCPRGCKFCHVAAKEGQASVKVADLSEFWRGQKNIVLCDPNILACPNSADLLKQLIDSKAKVDLNQGVDVRLITDENLELLKQIKLAHPHIAWDNYADKDMIVPKIERFANAFPSKSHWCICYILVNFDSTLEQDMDRVMILRSLGVQPYIMRYNKEGIPRGHILNKLARWCNYPAFFWAFDTLDKYLEFEKQRYKPKTGKVTE